VSGTAAGPASAPASRRIRQWAARHKLALAVTGVVAIGALAFLVHWAQGENSFSLIDQIAGGRAYLWTFLLIFGDAICPIFPGETTLNAASTLAAQGALDLGLVMLAGALGAIAGDSTLYWIARTSARRIEPQLEKARGNEKVAAALDLMGSSGPILIVAGRYVPGLRFVVNATMGLARYPYPRFLLWSGIGGAAWSVYTCLLAYAIGTALSGFPLASVVISGLVTTVAITVVFFVLRSRRRAARARPA
jgi:membrane-associated protein